MFVFIMTLHVVLALTLVGVILLQKSDGGGLAAGNTGGMGNFMNPRGAANFMTKLTVGLAMAFLATNVALVVISARQNKHSSITQAIETQEAASPKEPTPPVSGEEVNKPVSNKPVEAPKVPVQN